MGTIVDGRDAVAERVRRAWTAVTRTTPGPLLVRAGVFVAFAAGFLLAYPVALFGSTGLMPLLLLATLPALAPRSLWATVVVLLATAGWLISTIAYAEPVTLWRLVGLASTLYIGHTLTALAAVLPYDAVVDADVLARWLGRALLVVALTAGLGLTFLVAATVFGGPVFLGASLIGLAIAVGIATLLAALLRKRSSEA